MSTMKKAAVAIDRWKRPIFERHLSNAGYSFTEAPGVTPDTVFLMVATETAAALQPVIESAQRECAKKKAN